MSRIVIIQGHPDISGAHLCHALADAYAQGARSAGHEVARLDAAAPEFPWLHRFEDFYGGTVPAVLRPAQEAIGAADHLMVIYPLWLGTMPAILKAFFEQVMRPGFAFAADAKGGFPAKLLNGKSARIVITMGMPTLFYRLYFRAHSLKSLERNILGFCGIGPIHESLFGMVEAAKSARRVRWLNEMRRLGAKAR